jgi:hypothetical protein
VENKNLDPQYDALLARALAMIVMGQRGRFDRSRGSLEADCHRIKVSISTVSISGADFNCLSVNDGTREVLAVTWLPDDSRLAVGTYRAGSWEDSLFEAAKPHLSWLERRRWKKRQRHRVH